MAIHECDTSGRERREFPDLGFEMYWMQFTNQRTKFALESNRQILQQFKDKILPQDHPLTIHIASLVNRLLAANNLGELKDYASASLMADEPFRTTFEDSFGTGEGSPLSSRKWNLVVVNDNTIVNAMASFGNLVTSHIGCTLNSLTDMVVVFTGILPVAKDEQGLAAVLAHGSKFIATSPVTFTHTIGQRSVTLVC